MARGACDRRVRSHRPGGVGRRDRGAGGGDDAEQAGALADAVAIELPWLLPDGRAAGRGPDGTIVRATGALPGDHVDYRRVGGTGSTVDAETERIVVPSPGR